MTAIAAFLPDPEATERLGGLVAVAMEACAGGLVELHGYLGAGKTAFARGFLRAAGVEGIVRSPTYTVMEPYRVSRGTILHMDLYRLTDPEEWWQLGADSYPIEQSLWLVEWPRQVGELLPPATLSVELAPMHAGRRVTLQGEGELIERLAPKIRENFKVLD